MDSKTIETIINSVFGGDAKAFARYLRFGFIRYRLDEANAQIENERVGLIAKQQEIESMIQALTEKQIAIQAELAALAANGG